MNNSKLPRYVSLTINFTQMDAAVDWMNVEAVLGYRQVSQVPLGDLLVITMELKYEVPQEVPNIRNFTQPSDMPTYEEAIGLPQGVTSGFEPTKDSIKTVFEEEHDPFCTLISSAGLVPCDCAMGKKNCLKGDV